MTCSSWSEVTSIRRFSYEVGTFKLKIPVTLYAGYAEQINSEYQM